MALGFSPDILFTVEASALSAYSLTYGTWYAILTHVYTVSSYFLAFTNAQTTAPRTGRTCFPPHIFILWPPHLSAKAQRYAHRAVRFIL